MLVRHADIADIWSYFIAVRYGSMGNQACCEDMREEKNPIQAMDIQKVVLTSGQKVQGGNGSPSGSGGSPHSQAPQAIQGDQVIVVEITSEVKKTIARERFFQKEMEGLKRVFRKYGPDVYEGELDGNGVRPHGWGKMHKADGSCFMGHFTEGRAQGKGAFVFADGSFFVGEFVNNFAHCQRGHFESCSCAYTGGFQENVFHGEGREQATNYVFQGVYKGGKRHEGVLKWKLNEIDFTYRGTFDQKEQFHGHGVLEQKLGTYTGDFLNGLKHGKGQYKGENGVRYIGEYREDKKQGEGTIFNYDGTVAYRGGFKNGLPHGRGSAFAGEREVETVWEEGIDTRLLQLAKE